MDFSWYTQKTIQEVFEKLKTSSAGLSDEAVLALQKEHGFNEVEERGGGALEVLKRQFSSPFFYLLFVAGVISMLIGERVNSIVIIAFVVLNVGIGFFQEYRAQRAIYLLKKLVPQKVKVIRDNALVVIEKKYLVIGDIVTLEAGDIVPAELRIIQENNFLVDESVLTGESLPVSKTMLPLKHPEKDIFKSTNMLFAGTSVTSGKAMGVVVAVGQKTQLGEIMTSVATVNNRQSTYEKNLLYFCRLILRIVVTTIVFIFILNFVIKGTENLLEFSLFCVSLIVSILPEALPAIVIFSLSRGSLKMAKDQVVVKRLSAVEDLGNIEILCADKTGTLTQNILSLDRIIAPDKQKALVYALLSADTLHIREGKKMDNLNPFDRAFLKRADYAVLEEAKKFTKLFELPFDSFRMKSSCLVKNQKDEKYIVVKGAAEILLASCSKLPKGETKKSILSEIEKEGQDGKRVLAIAYKELTKEKISKSDEKGLTFLGYFVFEDPLKATAKESIRLAKKLQVQIKIITGDSAEISRYIAKEVDLIPPDGKVVLGEELEALVGDEFDDACHENSVFARISPDTKHRIIKSLQKKYEVGFLGEGINDAPALKTADVGIAVFEATDIAREAADVVLLEKDLRVVINGIKNGRVIFANINKYIKCALASNFGNFYSIAVISLFVNFLPMLPVQILLGNLLSDFPLISIASDSVDLEELRKPKMYQLHMVLPLIISLALVSTLFDFIFFTIFYHQPPGVIQTLWFIESILTEILLVFIIRTRNAFWKAKRPSFALLLFTILDGAFIIALPFFTFGQSFFHFVRPPFMQLGIVIISVTCYFAVSEVVKLVYFRHWKTKPLLVK